MPHYYIRNSLIIIFRKKPIKIKIIDEIHISFKISSSFLIDAHTKEKEVNVEANAIQTS